MGTRSGDTDPGTCSFLAENAGMSVKEVTDLLNKKSGLPGISELSNDCRTIQEAADEGHADAKPVPEVMTYRPAKYTASMAVATGGIGTLVFAGGIGENSNVVRNKTIGYPALYGADRRRTGQRCHPPRHGGHHQQSRCRARRAGGPTNEERNGYRQTGGTVKPRKPPAG